MNTNTQPSSYTEDTIDFQLIEIHIYIPLGILCPLYTMSSEDSFATYGATGYNLIVSLIHIVI